MFYEPCNRGCDTTSELKPETVASLETLGALNDALAAVESALDSVRFNTQLSTAAVLEMVAVQDKLTVLRDTVDTLASV